MLVEVRTYLGYEITTTLGPWVLVLPFNEYPELIDTCIQASGTQPHQGEYPLHPDAVKICLEDKLLAAGLQLIYANQPVGFNFEGLIIGNKSGRQVIDCQVVIDCTPTAIMARLTGASFYKPCFLENGKLNVGLYAITLEFEGVAFQEEGNVIQNVLKWDIPPHLSAVIKRARTHRGCRPDHHAYRHGHTLIEVILELPWVNTSLEMTNRYLTARRHALDFASYLLWENHFFRQAYLGSISQDVFGPQASPMSEPVPGWARILDEVLLFDEIPISLFAAPAEGVFCLNAAARIDGGSFRDPLKASQLGAALGGALKYSRKKIQGEANPSTSSGYTGPDELSSFKIREPESPQRGRYPQIPVPSQAIPVLAETDVLVVGGGISGAMAAITAAQAGMQTLILEMNPGLGGTATFGGVHHYWGGYQHGFVQQSIKWVN